MTGQTFESAIWRKSSPRLSVLIPFFRDDASDLISELEHQLDQDSVEILIHDDGTRDQPLTAKIESLIAKSPLAIRLFSATENQGRSAARNALQLAARSDWVLFLDADMRPAQTDFLRNYLDLISQGQADIIFGGFHVEAQKADKDRDLHRALSDVSDCLSLAERQAAGAQFVASSNLCVSKQVLETEPFDDGFSGWGWEDSEWAARVSKRFTLIHIDNPAIHLGLETTETLLRRFATSGQNYKRFVTLHPDLAPQLALYRISSKLGRVPGQKLMRPALKALVKAAAIPMKIRLNALKLWRASHYAEALR
ncbi:glycosyltransferase family 2 protein [Litorimonas sp. WD9-15]|uniref:glycosyltransferase family 2 protein n=1 Tax=Litorimonas sp. WD9-15 TaxID=3418716 RepID=UPI003CFFD234